LATLDIPCEALVEKEWGVTYPTEQGDLHTEWGYTKNPLHQIDQDGEIQIGKRDWVKAYEVKSRPVVTETVVWQSDDCPWRMADQ
jgi:hypothetical protein